MGCGPLFIGLVAVAAGLLVGLLLGLVAGTLGWLETGIGWLTDILLSFLRFCWRSL